MRGIRSRLAFALVALVVLTVAAIGLGTYAFVEARLRDGLLADATRQAQFNLSVLVPERMPAGVTREGLEDDELATAFRLRGDVETIVELDDGGGPYVSNSSLLAAAAGFPAELRGAADSGRLGFAWVSIDDRPTLVLGGRPGGPAAGGASRQPAFYFLFAAASIEEALVQLRVGLGAAALVAIVLAILTAGLVARGILRPVSSGSAAAARIAGGDLSARVPAGGADEFARFAAEFNRMADSLASTVTRLEASERQNRRFVSDVSHELRTPLTALVAEASIIEAGLAELPPDARRAAELLVADVRRLRELVDDLMELSRFDARAEQADLSSIDLASAVRSIVANRLPTARLSGASGSIPVHAEVRRLDRIVGNLLDNARHHAPGSPVHVEVAVEGAVAIVRVADRGPGVTPSAIAHLFDRFYTTDESRSRGSSGLGLAIAAEHAALLGGSLAAENRDGGGLVVALRLPVTGSLRPGDDGDTPGAEG